MYTTHTPTSPISAIGFNQSEYGTGNITITLRYNISDSISKAFLTNLKSKCGITQFGNIIGMLLIDAATHDAQALKKLKDAATNGNTDAQFRLGFFYSNGPNKFRDTIVGFNWFRKATLQGHAEVLHKFPAFSISSMSSSSTVFSFSTPDSIMTITNTSNSSSTTETIRSILPNQPI